MKKLKFKLLTEVSTAAIIRGGSVTMMNERLQAEFYALPIKPIVLKK